MLLRKRRSLLTFNLLHNFINLKCFIKEKLEIQFLSDVKVKSFNDTISKKLGRRFVSAVEITYYEKKKQFLFNVKAPTDFH